MAIAAPGQLNVSESPSWGSRSVDCFEKLEQIGEGTYGQVYMAKEIKTGEIVALKKIRMDNEREGFPITAICEIKILKKLHHENVIKLKEIVTSPGAEKDEQGRPDGNKYKGGIYMVFEYMDHDLTGLADRPGMRFSVPQIKCYMRQLLTGLHYCHVNQVLHRDIKGSNLLIDNEGNLKLADFGLARSFSSDHNGNLTNRVITLWYRPPELLLGTTKYGPAVDMWSVGCIFAELLHGKPIFPGKDEGQLDVELNDVGRKQAAAVAQRLSWEPKVSVVYSSDLKRAVDTAEAIASSCGGLQVIKDPDLRERHLGDLQGLVHHEAVKLCPKAYRALSSRRTDQEIPGGGENLDQLYDRCTSALERISVKHKGERVVVVTHGGVIRSLFERASPSGQPGRVLNTSVNVFHLSDGDIWTIKSWGDVSHLNQTDYLNSGFGGDRTSG